MLFGAHENVLQKLPSPLTKPCLQKPLWVMQSNFLGTDFFISLYEQNIPGYKATLPVLASVCTINYPLSQCLDFYLG